MNSSQQQSALLPAMPSSCRVTTGDQPAVNSPPASDAEPLQQVHGGMQLQMRATFERSSSRPPPARRGGYAFDTCQDGTSGPHSCTTAAARHTKNPLLVGLVCILYNSSCLDQHKNRKAHRVSHRAASAHTSHSQSAATVGPTNRRGCLSALQQTVFSPRPRHHHQRQLPC